MDTISDHLQLAEGRWWRFSAYEVHDGWVRPAKGAKLEKYDPWADHAAALEDRQAADPKISQIVKFPYQKLMDLAEVRPRETAKVSDIYTSWCREFGLLGLMSHRVLAVTFPPRWVHSQMDDKVVPGVTRWIRRADGWQERSRVFYLRNSDGSLVTGTPNDLGNLVGSCAESDLFPEAVAYRREISSFYPIESTPVESALADYFPDLSCLGGDGPRYLVPLSEQFWRESGEKVLDIYGTAFAFKRAMDTLAAKPLSQRADSPDVDMEMERLAAFASGVSQELVTRSDGGLRLRWTSTSLLASLATMAMQDLAEGRVRRCGARKCGRVFASASDRAVYCSSRCREREMKGRHRARQKTNKKVAN